MEEKVQKTGKHGRTLDEAEIKEFVDNAIVYHERLTDLLLQEVFGDPDEESRQEDIELVVIQRNCTIRRLGEEKYISNGLDKVFGTEYNELLERTYTDLNLMSDNSPSS